MPVSPNQAWSSIVTYFLSDQRTNGKPRRQALVSYNRLAAVRPDERGRDAPPPGEMETGQSSAESLINRRRACVGGRGQSAARPSAAWHRYSQSPVRVARATCDDAASSHRRRSGRGRGGDGVTSTVGGMTGLLLAERHGSCTETPLRMFVALQS